MSTGISRGPICPSCGEESLPTARRCWLCLTPFAGGVQTAPAERLVRPPHVSEDPFAGSESDLPELPNLRKHGLSAGQVSAIVLAVICALVAFATQGLGLWLFVVLMPIFVLLAWPGRHPTPDGYVPAMKWWAAAAAVFLIVVCFVITFVAVCFPVGFLAFSQSFENPNPPPSATVLWLAAYGLGLLAAGVVAWLLVRRFWPRGGRR